MSDGKKIRLSKALKELNISKERAVEFLTKKDIKLESGNPNQKIDGSVYDVLLNGFQADKSKKQESKEVGEEKRREKEAIRTERDHEQQLKKEKLDKEKQTAKLEKEATAKQKANSEEQERKKLMSEMQKKQQEEEVVKGKAKKVQGPKTVGKIELDANKSKPKTEIEKVSAQAVIKQNVSSKEKEAEKPKEKEATADSAEKLTTNYAKLSGPKLTGQKIDLSQFNKPKKKDPKKDDKNKKRPRKRINKKVDPNKPAGQGQGGAAKKPNGGGGVGRPIGSGGGVGRPQAGRKNFKKAGPRTPIVKAEPTEAEISKQIKDTLDKLTNKGSKGAKGAKYRRQKRDVRREQTDAEIAKQEAEKSVLKVTEFVTVMELATMMDISINQVISSCMSLGIMVTMNQRLDAETLSIVAEEFGFETEFVSAELEESIVEVEDKEEDLKNRAPIVTVMGHVDHGKTSLLDYVRNANVIAGESGGITQHIGAYGVKLESGQRITFLDTPGHEAFTAMRARGAKVTDVAIIVIAADDDVMPQTKEAISHAQAAGVPIVFAINKVDKPHANPDNIKNQLSQMNLLIEEWGGKIQSHEISAKTGQGVTELMEKVLLEAEMLDLKANPEKSAVGNVVEASLDKGRGYVSTILVQAGTLRIGDYMLAGKNSGKVKAMFDERGKNVLVAGPSTPVSVLGLDGAPQAGDKFNIFDDEREAKQIAARRTQLQREQSVRTQKHITLDEIGRRIAIGDFQELNIILKGDVDGSVEALSASLQKLSTDEIHVNIIHKGVGQITESDVLLATASDAIIIGFQVRPSGNARVIADRESIDIRTYSIIYDAINEVKDAMEGMLSPEMKEEVTGNIEVRETFKISKVGTIAGCMVISGKVFRNSNIRIIRDGIVAHTGTLGSLKRYKDDVKEVAKGYECGLNIEKYNDIRVGDIIEAYQEVEVKKKL
ncbi:MAG: translation initiation factor IF-2 [Ichthyobacteriaceae bacterium]|nr:translation initiation factor IF-2 [Ichthyobacteriaceae bacterium]